MAEIPSPNQKSQNKEQTKDVLDSYDMIDAEVEMEESQKKAENSNQSSEGTSEHQMNTGRSQMPLIQDVNIVESRFQEGLVKNVKDSQFRQKKMAEFEEEVEEFKISKGAKELGLRNPNSFQDDDYDEDQDEDGYQFKEVVKYVDARSQSLNGSFKPIILLISEGILSPDLIIDQESGYRIIHLIAHFGKVKALQTLVTKLKADVNLADAIGQTAIHLAALSGEIEILRYLASLSRPNISVNHPLELEV